MYILRCLQLINHLLAFCENVINEKQIQSITDQCTHHIETSYLTCCADQLTMVSMWWEHLAYMNQLLEK